MKIIAFDRFKPGVTMETIQPLLAEEVANAWRLWKAGVVRENYARADVADFPMTKAGYLEWSFVALMAPVMLESQFEPAALARAGLAPDRPAALREA